MTDAITAPAMALTRQDSIREGGLVVRDAEPKILVVDPDKILLKRLTAVIVRRGCVCDTATSLEEAYRAVDRSGYDLLILDPTLPDGSGLSLIDKVKDRNRHTLIVLITARLRISSAVQVIRAGAYDFIPKPFTLRIFTERLAKAIDEWRSRICCQYYQAHLEQLVSMMTERLAESSRQIDQTYDMAVSALGAALDLKDPETEEHCRRVSEHSVRLGESLGLCCEELRNLKWSAYLHDIGKIGIPEYILDKSSGLTAAEMEIIKGHPMLGYEMINHIDFLKYAGDVVLFHHEKYDGSGYPFGLKGKRIPLSARIFAIVDAVDSMLFDRPYRKALPFSHIVEELRLESGKHFDPDIVGKFMEIYGYGWNRLQEPGRSLSESAPAERRN